MRYAHSSATATATARWAQWLHRRIEGYRPPRGIITTRPLPSLRPLFLDRAELPTSSDLAATCAVRWRHSAALIVICSKAAAQSRWVNEEVRAFKALGRGARIFCFVVDGALGSGEAFPPALRHEVRDGVITDRPAAEPLAADVRPGGDDRGAAALKIIAGLLDVPLDRLRQREARAPPAAPGADGGAVGGRLCRVRSDLGGGAAARRGAHEAERESLTAHRTADFMKSLFAVSDPSEARGNSITAREVLDRGVRQIDTQLKNEPLVRADLVTTLGEVYSSLGLYQESLKLSNDAGRTPGLPPELAARNSVSVGELQVQRGEYPEAARALSQAAAAVRSGGDADGHVRMRIWAAFGDMYRSTDDAQHAREYFARLLALASHAKPDDPGMRIHALEGIAQVDLDDGKFDAAKSGFEAALAQQIALTGEIHPRASELLNELGSLEYLRGRREAAIPYYRRCLEIERQLFGPRHPSTASSQNNLARMLLEERKFDEADALLQESIATSRASVAETSDAMTFRYANLALVRMGEGDLQGAEPLFQKALTAAVLNKHRLHGPILTDLADLECRLGQARTGAGEAR